MRYDLIHQLDEEHILDSERLIPNDLGSGRTVSDYGPSLYQCTMTN